MKNLTSKLNRSCRQICFAFVAVILGGTEGVPIPEAPPPAALQKRKLSDIFRTDSKDLSCISEKVCVADETIFLSHYVTNLLKLYFERFGDKLHHGTLQSDGEEIHINFCLRSGVQISGIHGFHACTSRIDDSDLDIADAESCRQPSSENYSSLIQFQFKSPHRPFVWLDDLLVDLLRRSILEESSVCSRPKWHSIRDQYHLYSIKIEAPFAPDIRRITLRKNFSDRRYQCYASLGEELEMFCRIPSYEN